jgi:pimeloyl-ACP methyl ester carboxylesterase
MPSTTSPEKPGNNLTEHRIDVEGGDLFVVEHGSGMPLLLLHGWPLDHRMFEPQFRALAAECRCIAPDRRGFGRSTAPPDMRREPDDIDRVLAALDIDTVHLLGVSQGGRIALRYAATRPSRVGSLLLQGAVVDGLDIDDAEHEQVPVVRYAELAGNGRLGAVKADWLAHPMMALPPGHDRGQQLLEKILDDYDGADLARFEPASYAFDQDVLSALEVATFPVLTLTGAGETAARKAHAREICRHARRCREIEFGASGHLPNLTEPDAFNRAVRDFLATVDSVAA